MAALSVVLGACENMMYGARQGTIEYPGSAAGANAAAVYVVKDKDTVESVSQRYGVSQQVIIDRNNLKAPYTLRPGQNLALPGAKYVAPADQPAPTQAAASSAPGGPVKREELAAPGETKTATASGQPTPLSPPAREVTVAATPPRFEWPVNGKVVSTYGTAGGQKNDGIDIAAAKGTPVKAAGNGSVVYAGNEVKGMGNLLLVSHDGGYITAYGNNDVLLVKKGDTIRKGQEIAKVGNSSGTGEPRLHFEVRRANKTIDPMTVLPAQ